MPLVNTNIFRIDSRYFKAFMAVAEHKSFTLAADRAGMTQSVVSDHIAKLEHQLKHTLIIRTSKPNKDAVLTDAGKMLFQYILQQIDNLSELFFNIDQRLETLEGPVQFSLPPSCSRSPWFRQVLAIYQQLQGIELKIDFSLNNDTYDAVSDGRYHFGLMTEKVESLHVHYQHVFTEEYVAVTAPIIGVEYLSYENIVNQRFIVYPGVETYTTRWLEHHLPHSTHAGVHAFQRRCEINTIEGAVTMLITGHGLSIMPRHYIEDDLERGTLTTIADTDHNPLFRPVYLAYINSIALPLRVKTLIDIAIDPQKGVQLEVERVLA